MDTTQTTCVPAVLGRLLWMMVGPITLIVLALSIAGQRGGWFTIPGLAYLPVLGATMLGRWLEFRTGHPMTSTGEPATAAHLRHYLLAATTLGLAGFVVANLARITG